MILDAYLDTYWASAIQGVLLIQECEQCGNRQHYPRVHCTKCGSFNLAWRESSGFGVVYSKTIVHVEVRPDLIPPYAVGVVDLKEGPRMTAMLTRASIEIGANVKLRWEPSQDERELPRPWFDLHP